MNYQVIIHDAKEVERYLKAYGYKLDRIRGSHHVWVNDAGIPKPLR